ncbi:MAG: hypothetical protein Q9M31_01810 [Mariprofundus sp.]|nr:hypothetical protein [Mariprofundus sp.]
MALTEKQKQKKLGKKNKKRQQTKKLSSQAAQLRNQASSYAELPIHECLVPDALFDQGIGHVIISRRKADGNLVLCMFLADIYCLGVKDAFFRTSSEYEYEHTIKAQIIEIFGPVKNVLPSCVRALIEGAVLYAHELGFSPHPDYKNAKGIFGNIDAASSPVSYTYGDNGKPFYIRGPSESPAQAKRIVAQLERKCGTGNYEYIVMTGDDIVD